MQAHVRGHLAGENLEKAELAVLVAERLVDDGAGRAVRVGRDDAAVLGGFGSRVKRRRDEIDDGVQKLKRAEPGERAAAEHRIDLAVLQRRT